MQDVDSKKKILNQIYFIIVILNLTEKIEALHVSLHAIKRKYNFLPFWHDFFIFPDHILINIAPDWTGRIPNDFKLDSYYC